MSGLNINLILKNVHVGWSPKLYDPNPAGSKNDSGKYTCYLIIQKNSEAHKSITDAKNELLEKLRVRTGNNSETLIDFIRDGDVFSKGHNENSYEHLKGCVSFCAKGSEAPALLDELKKPTVRGDISAGSKVNAVVQLYVNQKYGDPSMCSWLIALQRVGQKKIKIDSKTSALIGQLGVVELSSDDVEAMGDLGL